MLLHTRVHSVSILSVDVAAIASQTHGDSVIVKITIPSSQSAPSTEGSAVAAKELECVSLML